MADSSYNNNGALVISNDVIAAIAINAVKDVEGVEGMGFRPKDSLRTILDLNSENLKHVKVDKSDYDVKLHLYLIISPAAKIQDVTIKAQDAVKAAVQNMTGLVATRVDVTVSGIASESN